MEHLPAPPLCLYWKNQSHRFFLPRDAQLQLAVLQISQGAAAGRLSPQLITRKQGRGEANL